MGALRLDAFVVSGDPTLELHPGGAQRLWMRQTTNRFAQRCLPMLIADQSGWVLVNKHPVSARWNGSDERSGLRVLSAPGSRGSSAVSHFGHGILTWTLPFLFRTAPGYNLLLRGPANRPKDGASPLEGVVESDGCPATAAMNWQVTRPGHEVVFEVDEPIAMLVPVRRGELEEFDPHIRALSEDPRLRSEYESWREDRAKFIGELVTPRESRRDEWQGDYFKGAFADQTESAHQTRLVLRPFSRKPPG